MYIFFFNDTWQMTGDTWHVTHDTWQVVNIVSKFQVPSSNGLGFMMFWRFGGKGSVNHLISDEAVCRTAPSTPGLLIILYLYLFCRPGVAGAVLLTAMLVSDWLMDYISPGPLPRSNTYTVSARKLILYFNIPIMRTYIKFKQKTYGMIELKVRAI